MLVLHTPNCWSPGTACKKREYHFHAPYRAMLSVSEAAQAAREEAEERALGLALLRGEAGDCEASAAAGPDACGSGEEEEEEDLVLRRTVFVTHLPNGCPATVLQAFAQERLKASRGRHGGWRVEAVTMELCPGGALVLMNRCASASTRRAKRGLRVAIEQVGEGSAAFGSRALVAHR